MEPHRAPQPVVVETTEKRHYTVENSEWKQKEKRYEEYPPQTLCADTRLLTEETKHWPKQKATAIHQKTKGNDPDEIDGFRHIRSE